MASIGEFRYDVMWAAREGEGTTTWRGTAANTDSPPLLRRRSGACRFKNEMEGMRAAETKLAAALAAIDGMESAEIVFMAIANPRQWDEYTCLAAAERLLMAGVVLPAPIVFALADSVLERTELWMSDQDRYLLRQVLLLSPFVEDPTVGIAKVRDVIGARQFPSYELNKLVTALGESRSEAAIDLLSELAWRCGDVRAMRTGVHQRHCQASISPDAREWFLGAVDPDIGGIALPRHRHSEEAVIIEAQRTCRG